MKSFYTQCKNLTAKMDEQAELRKEFEKRIEANTVALTENKEDVYGLQEKMTELQNENWILKEAIAKQAHYKKHWNLRLNGLSQKEGEDPRDVVIRILTRVVPMSLDWLCETVDTVQKQVQLPPQTIHQDLSSYNL